MLEIRFADLMLRDGDDLPRKSAHERVSGGQNLSPGLEWEGVPSDAETLALAVVDTHAVANHWIHWMVINLPARDGGLPENVQALPGDAQALPNGYGDQGYGGPAPPPDTGPHDYEFHLYALDSSLELEGKVSWEAWRSAIKGKVLAEAKVTGVYER